MQRRRRASTIGPGSIEQYRPPPLSDMGSSTSLNSPPFVAALPPQLPATRHQRSASIMSLDGTPHSSAIMTPRSQQLPESEATAPSEVGTAATEESDKLVAAVSQKSKRDVLCRHAASGSCALGSLCPYRHFNAEADADAEEAQRTSAEAADRRRSSTWSEVSLGESMTLDRSGSPSPTGGLVPSTEFISGTQSKLAAALSGDGFLTGRRVIRWFWRENSFRYTDDPNQWRSFAPDWERELEHRYRETKGEGTVTLRGAYIVNFFGMFMRNSYDEGNRRALQRVIGTCAPRWFLVDGDVATLCSARLCSTLEIEYVSGRRNVFGIAVGGRPLYANLLRMVAKDPIENATYRLVRQPVMLQHAANAASPYAVLLLDQRATLMAAPTGDPMYCVDGSRAPTRHRGLLPMVEPAYITVEEAVREGVPTKHCESRGRCWDSTSATHLWAMSHTCPLGSSAECYLCKPSPITAAGGGPRPPKGNLKSAAARGVPCKRPLATKDVVRPPKPVFVPGAPNYPALPAIAGPLTWFGRDYAQSPRYISRIPVGSPLPTHGPRHHAPKNRKYAPTTTTRSLRRRHSSLTPDVKKLLDEERARTQKRVLPPMVLEREMLPQRPPPPSRRAVIPFPRRDGPKAWRNADDSVMPVGSSNSVSQLMAEPLGRQSAHHPQQRPHIMAARRREVHQALFRHTGEAAPTEPHQLSWRRRQTIATAFRGYWTMPSNRDDADAPFTFHTIHAGSKEGTSVLKYFSAAAYQAQTTPGRRRASSVLTYGAGPQSARLPPRRESSVERRNSSSTDAGSPASPLSFAGPPSDLSNNSFNFDSPRPVQQLDGELKDILAMAPRIQRIQHGAAVERYLRVRNELHAQLQSRAEGHAAHSMERIMFIRIKRKQLRSVLGMSLEKAMLFYRGSDALQVEWDTLLSASGLTKVKAPKNKNRASGAAGTQLNMSLDSTIGEDTLRSVERLSSPNVRHDDDPDEAKKDDGDNSSDDDLGGEFEEDGSICVLVVTAYVPTTYVEIPGASDAATRVIPPIVPNSITADRCEYFTATTTDALQNVAATVYDPSQWFPMYLLTCSSRSKLEKEEQTLYQQLVKPTLVDSPARHRAMPPRGSRRGTARAGSIRPASARRPSSSASVASRRRRSTISTASQNSQRSGSPRTPRRTTVVPPTPPGPGRPPAARRRSSGTTPLK